MAETAADSPPEAASPGPEELELNQLALALRPPKEPDPEAEPEAIPMNSLLSVDVNPYVADNGTKEALQECFEILNTVDAYFSLQLGHDPVPLSNASSATDEPPKPSLQSTAKIETETQQLTIPSSPSLTRLPSIDPYRLALYCADKAKKRNPSLNPLKRSVSFPKLIENNATLRHVAVLVISGCYELQALPAASIGVLGNTLHTLDVSYNALITFPSELCTLLRQLEVLNVSNNRLRFLPSELASLKRLEVLNVEGNQIAAFPCELRYSQSLRQLHVGSNPLVSDEEVEEITLMQEAATLQEGKPLPAPGATHEPAKEGGEAPEDTVGKVLSQPRPGIPSANRMLDDLLMLEVEDRRRQRRLRERSPVDVSPQRYRGRQGEPEFLYIDEAEDVLANVTECCLCKTSLLKRYVEALGAAGELTAEGRRTLPYVLINFVDFLGNKSIPFAFCVCGDSIAAEAEQKKTDPGEEHRAKAEKRLDDCGAIVVVEILDAQPVNYRKLDYSTAQR